MIAKTTHRGGTFGGGLGEPDRNHEDPVAILDLVGDILEAVGAHRHLANEVIERAAALGCDPLLVLAQRTGTSLARVYEAAANRLGFAFSRHVSDLVGPADFEAIPLEGLAQMRTMRAMIGDTDVLFAAPDCATLLALGRVIGAQDPLRGRLCMVAPTVFANAVGRHCGDRLLTEAIALPDGVTRVQGARMGVRSPAALVLLALLMAGLALGLTSPFGFSPLPAVALSLVLLVPSAFRLWAAFLPQQGQALAPARLLGDGALPLYSVLIPLRDEAHMVGQLVRAMRALDYPPEKLDIKFVVEADSPETIAAAARVTDDPRFSLVVVPSAQPATKPKALDYALPLVRGSHVVIFDAEDIPEPDQLRKAASLFAERDDLSCLQAALTVDNADRSWLSKMFAAEYAGHFEVLLPAIAQAGLPMPLGGSSNHFRTGDLRAIGAWDPYNVTEDADLGLRLARAGLGCAALASRTYEEAPVTLQGWVSQRSRWMKGWMQTLIVHNHDPVALWRDLGTGKLLAVNVFIGAMVISTALHGVFLVSLLASLIGQVIGTGTIGLGSLGYIVLLLAGYAGAAAVSIRGLRQIGRRDLAPWLMTLPAYWIVGGFAALAASWDLVSRPFYWAKTTHLGLSGTAATKVHTPYRPVSADTPAPGE